MTSKTSPSNETQNYSHDVELKMQTLKDENTQLKDEISILKKTIKELEDWNGDYQDNNSSKNTESSNLQSTIDLVTSRNRQLENDIQRIQLQQKNNQLALERLDEYEETISQLQDELDQLRSTKKKQPIMVKICIVFLLKKKKRYDTIFQRLEETRLESEEKILQIETNLKENFEQEKKILRDEIQSQEKQIETERNEREILQKFKDNHMKNEMEEQENRMKEINLREMFERQLIELNEEVQTLENDKVDLSNELNELRQQLQSRDRQIETFQTTAITPGSPPMIPSSSHIRDISPSRQTFEHESLFIQNKQELLQLNSIYDQFVTLLPGEFSLSDNTQLSLINRFTNLFEQFSTYFGTFSIIQEELDSLKQILIEKQDELEKLRTHLELTTDKLTQLHEEQSLFNKHKSYESDEDELEEILEFSQRAPSRQSLASITPGEKQQLIAQNELLSSLLNEKEQELVFLQQADKTREDLRKNLEILRSNLQQMEVDKEIKQIELNDIRNILDEKLRENSSLKKEKMYFIEKLAEFERDRQEQQAMIQILPKQTSPEKEKSPGLLTKDMSPRGQNMEQIVSQEQYEKLRIDYDELLELSKRQHEESLSYYNEYTRIISLYNELNTKHSQLQINYDSLQSLIQQKNEAYLQCQNELNTYQNLLYHQKKKSDDIDVLNSTLNERDIQLQQLIINEKQFINKQLELESKIKILEENDFKFKSNQQLFEQIQIDLKRISHERDLAVLLKYEESEQKLIKNIEYLQQVEQTLRNQLQQLNDSNRLQTELNVDGEQSQQILVTELELLKEEYNKLKEFNSNLNTQLQEQIKYSQNLENTQKQFQQEYEQYINEHQRQYQEQISVSARLTNENNEIRQRLEEYNQAQSSIYQLNDEMKTKDLLINKLQDEIDSKTKQSIDYNENVQTTNNTRIEKQIVKNILLSYFHTPFDKQQEVIPILSALVGFTQDEYDKAMNAMTNNYNNINTSTSWLTGWLGTNPSKSKSDIRVYHPDKSFAELLIQYVDQESTDNLQQPIIKSNTNEYNSTDQQLNTVTSISSNNERDTNLMNQSALPTSTISTDKISQI
ncbi:unnamed protein product [Adineta steineri]|uniref:GRIP domain-containing protein n=1 Tax=Adineta steineri TaxID=433720 RepID=A0A814S8A7_9BILA|nr:unnamed protein product [Adineta steineri]CAF1454942.1 unnamed protein product [Adineta steineri]